ncbi:Poly(A) polymerase I-like protein [Drosera capensis]
MLAWRRRSSQPANFFHPLKALLDLPVSLPLLPRFNRTFAEGGRQLHQLLFPSVFATGQEMSGWRKIDAMKFGLKLSMIPESPQAVLRTLKREGFEAYLVGGCVRDILMKKVPKDYDVVTTANLEQIKRKFRRAIIIGRRFPICKVFIKGSGVEVSSFETVAKGDKKKQGSLPKSSRSNVKMDIILWKNCIRRDFTVNSLFFDPFASKIYDYCAGMKDLMSMKLRTLLPAEVSFEEDHARILRGLRIAARVGLSLSNDIEIAIHKSSSLIKDLPKSRLMMELNYMLSYGAAFYSLSLLQRVKLLEILLPFQDAYLMRPSTSHHPQDSKMLMINWLPPINLVLVPYALVIDPQDALVVWTFCSVMYYGNWNEAVEVARVHANKHVNFVPELLKAYSDVSDEELALRVSEFASRVQDSIDTLTNVDYLLKAMARYPDATCSRLVFVSKKAGSNAAQIFDGLVKNIMDRKKKRESYEINYQLLGEGHIPETRFSLGKVIMNTLIGGIVQVAKEVDEEAEHRPYAAEHETKPREFGGNKCLAPDCKDMRGPKGKSSRRSVVETAPKVQLQGIKKQKLCEDSHTVVQREDTFPMYQGVEERRKKKVVEKHLQSEQKMVKKDGASRKEGKKGLAEETKRELPKQLMFIRQSCSQVMEANGEEEDRREPIKGTEFEPQTCARDDANIEIGNFKEQNEGMNHVSQKKRRIVVKDVMVKEVSELKSSHVKEPVEAVTALHPIYGVLVDNTAAGIAGGSGIMPGGNVGADHAVFEQDASAGNVGIAKIV